MEHKLVELVRSHMSSSAGSLADGPAGTLFPLLKRQIHQADIGTDRSGMICSGEQTVAFFLFHGEEHIRLVAEIIAGLDDSSVQRELEWSSGGVRIVPAGTRRVLHEQEWSYYEALRDRPRIAIVGAGHVSLALSRMMDELGFRVEVYDDRSGLNTWHDNTFAQQRTLVEYARIAEHLPADPELYVVLASFGQSAINLDEIAAPN